jgi:hypothetical protein
MGWYGWENWGFDGNFTRQDKFTVTFNWFDWFLHILDLIQMLVVAYLIQMFSVEIWSKL